MFSSHSLVVSRPAAAQPAATPAMPILHQYACVRCRSRKVKCDKIIPACAHCVDAGAQCFYAARRPRKSQKVQQVVQRPLLPAEKSYPSPPTTSLDTSDASPEQEILTPRDDFSSDDDSEDVVIPCEIRDSAFEARHDPRQADHGRLFVAQGRSRYINSEKANQLANLESVLASDYNARDERLSSRYPSPASLSVNTTYNSLLGLSFPRRSLRTYHPHPEIMGILWEYYVRNIDILVKILYKPTVESIIKSASLNLESLDASTETLLFAVWFATVTTMSREECLRLHKEERSLLLSRYRHALEQALAQAEWMTSQKIEVLQALIIFIVCAPSKNARLTWMMSGIALGIAQAMGMHSDSASFGMGLVETEVRRRVWWSLCQLDNRISDDCGLEPHVPLTMDTKLPLHINDSDLRPDNVEALAPRTEFTEMTTTLVKIEFAETCLKVKRSKHGNSPLSTRDVAILAREQIRQFEEVYLTYFNTSLHLHRLCYLGVRLIIAKLWKMTYNEPKQSEEVTSEEVNEPLLLYNANLLEITSQFPDDLRQFGWFFRCRYTQWHAMANLLIELCKHAETQGPAVDRAWAVLDSVFDKPEDHTSEVATSPASASKENTKSALWQPLQKLHKRAQQARIQALQIQDPGSKPTTAAPVEEPLQGMPHGEALLTDPFLGSEMDFSQEMSWEQLDGWVKDFQPELFYQDDNMDFQTQTLTRDLSWW